eukprot:scaffold9832_cov61-Phaeocystis_antarctica.AAC.2
MRCRSALRVFTLAPAPMCAPPAGAATNCTGEYRPKSGGAACHGSVATTLRQRSMSWRGA